MTEKQQILDKMIAIAKTAVENSDGKLNLEYEKDSGHFFKFNDKQIGRCFESYSFDSEMVGQLLALIEFSKDMAMLKTAGLSNLWEAVRHDCANLSEFLTGQNEAYIPTYRALFSIPSPKKSVDQ